ncbi:MAG TPA: hypothetical protein PKY81_00820 [bacterium]|nr:hypothetical protein [bacterium]HPN29475.1 hypothetical protein [bacterium]
MIDIIKTVFITIDVDWACDEALRDTVNLLEKNGVASTIFCTHKSEILNELSNQPGIELGIHPNFNPLLNGDLVYGKNFKEVIGYFYNLVASPVSFRCHSMTYSSQLANVFSSYGLIYDCNYYIPHYSEIELKPYRMKCNKLIKAPYYWEDDLYAFEPSNKQKIENDIKLLLSKKGLKIFDFHPAHIFLNTNALKKYEAVKDKINDADKFKLGMNSYSEAGIRYFFIKLIEFALDSEFQFKLIKDIKI